MPVVAAAPVEPLGVVLVALSQGAGQRIGALGDGHQIYFQKGNCANCHAIQAKGGRLGPELGAIGASRKSVFLRRALLDPEAELPGRTYLDRRRAGVQRDQ